MKPFKSKQGVATVETALVLLLVGVFPAAAQFPGFGGGGGGTRGTGATSGGLQAATRVSVVADEYSNSLIILAPEPYHEAISNLVRQLDVPVQDITELRAFQLRNADPTEMAKVLTSLFPDPTTSTTTGGRGQGTFFGGGGGRGGATTTGSERALKQGKVLAVADPRTSSVLVSASKDLMEQIAPMIAELDASTSKKQQVYVHTLENADPQEVETILRNLFETQNARNGRTAAQNNTQNNALQQRSSNAARNQGTTTGTSSGLGTTGGLGGQGGTGR